MRRTWAGLVLTGVLAVTAVACGEGGSPVVEAPDGGATGPTATLPPPEGLPAFYGAPDPIPDAEPGTLLRDEVVPTQGVAGTVHRVLYASRSALDEPVVVSGLVAVPDTPAPEGGYPVLAWAHGTTGIADACAPSLLGAPSIPLLDRFLALGYVVAATDYEGLGTPGRHPYVVGDSEGHGVLDSVRAAGQVDGVTLDGRFVVWGHSQGGHAALFAQHQAAGYAPELTLVGTVSGAPPSQFSLFFAALGANPAGTPLLLLVAAGFNAAYGDSGAPLDAVLTPGGVTAVDVVDRGCDLSAGIADVVASGVDLSAIVADDPANVPSWSALLTGSDPGAFTEPAPSPLLVIHGGADALIPPALSALMFQHLCDIGQDETRWVYPGTDHGSVIPASTDDMLTWIQHRFAGDPTPDAMVPAGQPDVETQSCPAG